MALIKKAGIWHYDFRFKGRHFQGSTYQRNIEKARLVQAKVKSDAGLAVFGIEAPRVLPTFKEFAEGDFTNYVAQHNKAKPRTIAFYAEKLRRLLEFEPLARARLNEIHEGLIEKYKQAREGQARRSHGKGKVAAGSVNRELATLRKALRLAYSYQLISRVPVIRLLPGEIIRDYVLDGATETRYLAAADYPLRQAAILMIDLGLRPEELVRSLKTDVSFFVGQGPLNNIPEFDRPPGRNHKKVHPDPTQSTFTIRDGEGAKTGSRIIPLPGRSIEVLEFLFELWPDSPWVFPGQGKGKHLTVWALDNLHAAVREVGKFPKEFVLYSCRHTFGTRLAESGAQPWEIKRLMGHASVRTSERYVHTGAQSVELAMRRKEAYDRVLRGEMAHLEASLEEDKRGIFGNGNKD